MLMQVIDSLKNVLQDARYFCFEKCLARDIYHIRERSHIAEFNNEPDFFLLDVNVFLVESNYRLMVKSAKGIFFV